MGQSSILLVLALLVVTGLCQHSSVSLRGDGAGIEWVAGSGDRVATLKRQGSVLELDSPLYAEELHVGNLSLAGAHALIADLTAEVASLQGAVAGSQSLWKMNSNWFDLGTTVNASLKGFLGGFASGGFAYYVPFFNNDAGAHGKVVRINTASFASSSVEWFDLEATVNSSLKDFHGGFPAGGFAYYSPGGDHGKVVRINMSDFSPSGVEWFDLKAEVDPGLVGFSGSFAWEDYAYYVPLIDSNFHGRVVRVNMSNFAASSVEWFDLTSVEPGLAGFLGGFADGGFAYYVPYGDDDVLYQGRVVRVNTSNFTTSGVEWFNLTDIDSELKGFRGGFASGGYAYYVPFLGGNSDKLVRVDVSDFSPSGVQFFDLDGVSSALDGYWGGFAANGFGYYVPHKVAAVTGHGTVLRVDLSDFSVSGVQFIDLTNLDDELVAFAGGFADETYAYFVPHHTTSAAFQGRVVRLPLGL